MKSQVNLVIFSCYKPTTISEYHIIALYIQLSKQYDYFCEINEREKRAVTFVSWNYISKKKPQQYTKTSLSKTFNKSWKKNKI